MRLVWPDPAGLLPDRSDPALPSSPCPYPLLTPCAAAREILLQRGPMDEDDLLDAPDEASADLEPALHRPLSDVLDDHQEPIHVLADDRLAWIPTILDGGPSPTGSPRRGRTRPHRVGIRIWRRWGC